MSDFGSVVSEDVEHEEDVQPNVYRAPEVCLKAPWSYRIGIWPVGCLVSPWKSGGCNKAGWLDDQIWDLFEGKHIFCGKDPKEKRYMTRALLAEMIALMGPPNPNSKKGKRTAEFSDKDSEICPTPTKLFSIPTDQWWGGFPMPDRTSLEQSEKNLEDSNKEAFLRFVRKRTDCGPAVGRSWSLPKIDRRRTSCRAIVITVFIMLHEEKRTDQSLHTYIDSLHSLEVSNLIKIPSNTCPDILSTLACTKELA